MAAFKSKLETFRDWMISQGESDLWISDEVVTEVIQHDPKGKFKDYLRALKKIVDSYDKLTEVNVVCDLTAEETPEPTVSNSLGENTMNKENATQQDLGEILHDMEGVVGGEKELKRMLGAFEEQATLQAMITHGNMVDKSAALVISKSTSWASRNPKTATAVGVATVVAAGVGVYHLAKIAKTYI